jgi:hypothetical protein
VKKHKHANSTSASMALNIPKDHDYMQLPSTKAAERCMECNTSSISYDRYLTSCGHYFCVMCYFKTRPLYGRGQHICKACNKVIAITSCRHEVLPKLASVGGKAERDSFPSASLDPLHGCSVCGELEPLCELVALTACKHKPDTCTDCFRGWITSRFETSVQDGIRCPSRACGHKLTHADIKEQASSEDFAR